MSLGEEETAQRDKRFTFLLRLESPRALQDRPRHVEPALAGAIMVLGEASLPLPDSGFVGTPFILSVPPLLFQTPWVFLLIFYFSPLISNTLAV